MGQAPQACRQETRRSQLYIRRANVSHRVARDHQSDSEQNTIDRKAWQQFVGSGDANAASLVGSRARLRSYTREKRAARAASERVGERSSARVKQRQNRRREPIGQIDTEWIFRLVFSLKIQLSSN